MVSLAAQAGLELTTKSRMILNFELFIFPNAGVTVLLVWLRNHLFSWWSVCSNLCPYFNYIVFLVPTCNNFSYFAANLLPDDSVFYLGFIFFSFLATCSWEQQVLIFMKLNLSISLFWGMLSYISNFISLIFRSYIYFIRSILKYFILTMLCLHACMSVWGHVHVYVYLVYEACGHVCVWEWQHPPAYW